MTDTPPGSPPEASRTPPASDRHPAGFAPRTFLITWSNGTAELIEAHTLAVPTETSPYWTFWWKVAQYENRTVLAAVASRIEMVRDVTDCDTFVGLLP